LSACDIALSKAKALHIDECETFLSERKIITVRITDSEIAELKQNQERSLAIRIIHQKRIGSATTSYLEKNDAVESALKSTSLVKPKNYWRSLPQGAKFPLLQGVCDKKIENISGNQAIDLANTMINSATNDKRITAVSGSLNLVSEKIKIVNNNGLNCEDEATYIAGTINAESTTGSSPVSGIGDMSSRTMNGFNAESVGREAAEMCVGSINPQTCEPEIYSIIFEPYAIGEMLAYVFASNFNLKTYSEKRSCFADKIGEKIAAESFSLIDDPHRPEGIGSKPFDDEGTLTIPRPLIDRGIFSGTFSDSFYAFKEDQETTGNASRAGSPVGRSAQPIPFPAPHNLMVSGHGTSKEDMIKDTKKGLLVGRLWYTYAVNPEQGDFSCTARSGIRIIENGGIKSPGKSVRIVHNLPVLLQNISSIGNDTRNVLNWHSLPTVTPSVKVDGIKVALI